ncbi:MAG: ribosome silencing factor [Caldithrix sp. RBG_13_44_9]|nr:MAG: ribosome silencing factor [Caldithrix sp. RBG_13_44_9]
MKTNQLAQRAAELAWEKKGNDIVILDVKKLTDVTDYFIIISGESELHVKALSDYLEEKLDQDQMKVWHREGYSNLNWVLLDYVDVVIHIFKDQTRQYYQLEKLWGDARIIRIEEDAKNRIVFAE